jgi:hypothetical protein
MRSLALLRKDMLCSAQCWKEWGLAEDCAHLVVVLEKHYNNAKAFNASAPNQYDPTEFTWLLVRSGVLCVRVCAGCRVSTFHAHGLFDLGAERACTCGAPRLSSSLPR